MRKARVALVKGNNHYQNIKAVLTLLQKEIIKKVSLSKKLLIKPNFVSVTNKLAATNVEVVRALLDFFKPYYKGKIIIAENAALGTTLEGFKNFGYLKLARKYNVEFIDLAKDKFLPFKIKDIYGNKIKIGVAKTVLESDFRISICPPKTHNEVIITASIKNMVMGAIDNRALVHQGPRMTNYNLACLAKSIPPHLSIIDGTVGMEGNGPTEGTAIKANFALGSFDPLRADVITTKIMGFNPEDIGYLYFLKIPKNIEIIGEKIENCQVFFSSHRSLARQLTWKKKPGFKEKILTPIFTFCYLKAQQMPFYKTTWFTRIKEPIKKILGY